MSSGPYVRDQRAAIGTGLAFLCAGTFLLYDAFDARGARRPFWLHFFPGL